MCSRPWQMADTFGPDWERGFTATPPPDIGLPCDHARPCRYYRCKFHLAVDWQPYEPTAAQRRKADHPFRPGEMFPEVVYPHLRVEQLPFTCALDVAEAGPQRVEDVAALVGLTSRQTQYILADILERIGLRGAA